MGGDHLRTPTEARLHEERLADAPVIEQVTQRSVGRKEARPHGFHEEALLRFGSRDHLVRLRRVERERLLAEHVLAGGEEQQRVGRMTRMRRGDVHGIDVGVVGERLVAAQRSRDVESSCECLLHARADREPTAATVPPSISRMPSANRVAISPGPAMPQRITGRSSCVPLVGRIRP